MSRGETKPPGHFGSEVRREESRRMTYRCWANGCSMPGSIFPGGTESGVCAWHYGLNGDELPKASRVLSDWACLTRAVNACREFSNDAARATSPKASDQAMAAIWADLAAALVGSGWKARIEPRKDERLHEWALRAEKFLHNRVKEAVTGKVIASDYQKTPTVADMLTRVKGRLSAPIEDLQ